MPWRRAVRLRFELPTKAAPSPSPAKRMWALGWKLVPPVQHVPESPASRQSAHFHSRCSGPGSATGTRRPRPPTRARGRRPPCLPQRTEAQACGPGAGRGSRRWSSYPAGSKRPWVFPGQGLDQVRGQVLVEEELHEVEALDSFRSRSAAKARTAEMSAGSRSGKSARIWSGVMPEARYSRTS